MAKSEQKHRDGDVIFREGEAADAAYRILEGKVELSRTGENGPARLAVLGKGDLFGEMSLIDGAPRSATATVIGKAVLQAIPREQFLDELETDPKLAMSILRVLVKRLRAANEQLVRRGEADSKARNSKPAGKKARAGLLARLLKGDGGSRIDRIEVVVAPVAGDAGGELSRAIAAALERRRAMRVRVLGKAMDGPPPGDTAVSLAAFAAAARRLLAEMDADVLVHAGVPETSEALHVRFVSLAEEEIDRPGAATPFDVLPVPVPIRAEFADLLGAVVLAATVPRSDAKAQSLREALPEALEAATPEARNIPAELSTLERAAVNLCFGNALATLAHQRGAIDVFHSAAQAYQTAIEGLPRRDKSCFWAQAQKQLATALMSIAERADDRATYETAAEVFRNAIEAIDKYEHPREWAAMQNRLGEILYRLDMKSGEGDFLKAALAAFQAALQVYTKAETPMAWAEVMDNIGQAAQVAGQQMRDPDILERAIEASRAALDVRTREKVPLLWAASQNTMGSALFLLGRLVNDAAELERAAEAFAKAREVYAAFGSERMTEVTEKNLAHVRRLLEERQQKDERHRWWREETEAGPNVEPGNVTGARKPRTERE